MNRLLKPAVMALAILILFTANLYAYDKIWTFDAKSKVSINTVSSDCMVVVGNDDKIVIEVDADYSPRGSFAPRVKERGNYIQISEEMLHSNQGYGTWKITAPKDTKIRFSTASGDFLCRGFIGGVDANTASGSIELDGCTGDLDLNTASGRIELIGCEGYFDVNTASGGIGFDSCIGEFRANTASGKIDADDVEIGEYSSFSTASGRVSVSLAKTCQHDLTLSSASGRVSLDYNGNPIKGTFEFTSKVRGGRISAPFEFDDEETFRRWGDKYVTKTAVKDATEPLIVIETATGKADLKEN